MGCACRVTPLRIFIQGLSQVHKIETPSSFLRLRAPPTSAALYRNQLLVARPLHGSRHLNQEQGAGVVPSPPAGAEPEGAQASTDESSSANENRSGAVEPAAVTERATLVEPSTTADPATTPAPATTVGPPTADTPATTAEPTTGTESLKTSEPIEANQPADPDQAAEPSQLNETIETSRQKPKSLKFKAKENERSRGDGQFRGESKFRGENKFESENKFRGGNKFRDRHKSGGENNFEGRFKDKPWKSNIYRDNKIDDKPWRNREDGPRGSRPPREFKSNSASSEPIVGPSPSDPAPDVPTWKTQKAALKEKFPDGWQPRKRLSPDALAGIRALNAQFPDTYTTSTLASRFEVSPENIRRILKSSWQPSTDEEKDRQDRWFRRGMKVWDHQAALGMKPPRKWRLEGINRDPSYHVKRQGAIRRNRQLEEQDDREIRAKLGRPATRKTPRK
ncbi:hypothetical protein BGZ61DRAFT_448893 [Ilyonectria robusta]|uniref:uncharacterized protein n=1 Tax=Ilyonectria robusta TaxID=1079257 RepID=UPI001E8D16C3|nr:uncharacterized protein BGZ61DRAFT_448893 [Ilyonectria robusta]KAH8714353.1 hypothetical protein BGZ61DRAFT_448893 [Ilyonectria robusta]